MSVNLLFRCLSLAVAGSLLAQQCAALGQESAVARVVASDPTIPLKKGTEVKLVLLDSLSSATDFKGLAVRMAVAEDVLVDGVVVIPRGTAAKGVVKSVAKAVPGKSDWRLEVMPQEIVLANGTRLGLREFPAGEDGCAELGPCWMLYTWVAVLSPLVLAGLVVTSPFWIKSEREERAYRKAHPGPAIAPTPKQEMTREVCEELTMYTSGKLTVGAASGNPAGVNGAPTPLTAAELDTMCPAKPKPQRHAQAAVKPDGPPPADSIPVSGALSVPSPQIR